MGLPQNRSKTFFGAGDDLQRPLRPAGIRQAFLFSAPLLRRATCGRGPFLQLATRLVTSVGSGQ